MPAPLALALSPHLDDAAFSCGGLLAGLSAAGWRVVVATVFTASVPEPKGFALACQTDKGLDPSVDYMALRRTEDAAALADGDVAALEVKRAAARDQCSVDVGFWGCAVPGNVGALRGLHEAGVFGVKCFLVHSGVEEFLPLSRAELGAALEELARLDALMVVHADDADVIE